MSYESWRISYQSSEQAARAAYNDAETQRAEVVRLQGIISRAVMMYDRCAPGYELIAPLRAESEKTT